MQEDTSADVQLDDDIADLPLFGQPEAAETTAAPAETVEKAETEGTDSKEAQEDDKAAAEAKDTEATAEDGTKEADTEQTESEQEKGKPDPAAAYRAYQERQRTRQAVEQQIDEKYAPKSQEELYQENIDQGLTEDQAAVQAQIQALNEQMQYREQRAQIAELNAGLQAEAVNVLHDFPVFNPESPDYDADFATMVQSTYEKAARLQTDENGIILSAELPLYDYHKQMADIYNRGASKGAQQGQAEMQDMLSKVETPGSGSQGSKGPESLEEMYERLADVPLA